MNATFDRTYSNAPGFEGQDLTVNFAVTSWGSPMTREHPGDPYELEIGTCYVDDGEELDVPGFSPIGALLEWLEEKLYSDPIEPDDDGDDYDRLDNYERDR